MKTAEWIGILVSLSSALTSCAPKVYVIDRQTVLEEEAAGEWPKFEKDLLERAKAKGPTPFAKRPVNARRERLFNVLNGDMATTARPSKGEE